MTTESEPKRLSIQSRLTILLVAVGAIAILLLSWLNEMATKGPGAYLAVAAGAVLAAVVFAALRPSSGYYRLRPFEASGKLYAWLGVRLFRRFVLMGDYLIWLIRRRVPDFRVVRSRADADKMERFGRLAERVHVTGLVFLVAPMCWGLVHGQYGYAAQQAGCNVLFNLYPILLQRYHRARLDALARRRDRLQNRREGGRPNPLMAFQVKRCAGSGETPRVPSES
jgi:hypothetical protein